MKLSIVESNGITDEELVKRQELIKKHTDENGNINLYLVFKEFYEWLIGKRKG